MSRQKGKTGIIDTRFEEVCTALAANPKQVEAAKALGITPHAVNYLAHDPRVKMRVRELKTAMCREAMTVITEGMTTAAQALIEIAEGGEKESARVAAASKIMELGINRELDAMWDAVEELRARVEIRATIEPDDDD